MKKILSFLVVSLFCVAVYADMNVTGLIEDTKGEPIVGASVFVTDGNVGTISDYDGAFELSVPDGAKTLTVSFVGMKTQVVPVKRTMKIVLVEAAEALQGEVIAVAYGNVTKGSFVGSAQAVSSENIEKKSPTEISKALDGEVAGLQVINSSGQPGSNGTIVIRGYNSINGRRTPLYVVDGMPFDGEISSIDPGDIASTSILKDATATALYGSRGANGVVLITTKKGTSGEEGKIEIDVKGGANMRLLPLYDVISSPEEYLEMSWQSVYNYARITMDESQAVDYANKNLFSDIAIPTQYNIWNSDYVTYKVGREDRTYPKLINPYSIVNGNAIVKPTMYGAADGVSRKAGYENLESWKNAIFRTGAKAETTLRISGGTDKTTYYTSFGWLKDEGYYIGSDFQRFTVRSNISHEAKKWLKGTLNMSYTYSEMNSPGQGDNMNNGFNYVNSIPPIYPVYVRNADGTIAVDPYTGGPMYDYGMSEGEGRPFGAGINPAGAVRLDKENTVIHQLQVAPTLEFKLYKGLKFTLGGNFMYTGYRESQMTNKYYGDAETVGRVYADNYNMMFLTLNQLLEYTNTFGDHDISALAGHETQLVMSNYIYGAKNYLAQGNSIELGNAIQLSSVTGESNAYALESYFAQVTYAYDNRYHVSANYRADGSSRYSKGHRWGHFGSLGGAWSFTEESFMQDNDGLNEWIKNGKLRLSWGVLGNQLQSLYGYTDLYSIVNVGDRLGYVWSSRGNPDITWERTQQTDLGLEFSLNKYVDVELDYYYKLIDNLQVNRSVAPSLGYGGFVTNDAKMDGQGVEFTFDIHAYNRKNIKLDIRLNGGHYTNKMLEMPAETFNEDGSVKERMTMNGGMSVGHSNLDYYMAEYVGVDPQTGEGLYWGYYDSRKGGFDVNNDANDVTELDGQHGNYIQSVHQYILDNPESENYIERVAFSGDEVSYAAGSNYIGKSAIPDLRGGFGIDFEAYGFNLSVTCSYGIGGYGYDNTYALLMHTDRAGSYNWHVDMRNAWTDYNKDTDIPRLSNSKDNASMISSTRFLVRNDYLSLNNVRIGYNFPKKLIDKIKLNKLNLYVTADNLAIATRRNGYNPSVSYSGSSDSYQYTPLSTIMGGIKLEF